MSSSLNIGRTMKLTNYEKLRQDKIEENTTRMEALGLRNIASSYMSSFLKNRSSEPKSKRKLIDEDEEYLLSQREEELPYFSNDAEFLVDGFTRPRLDERLGPEVQRVGVNRSSKRLALTRPSNNIVDASTCTKILEHQNEVSNDVDNNMTPDEAIHIGSTSKPKRGPTRNLAFAKKKTAGQKLLIEIAEDDKRVVGKDSKYFIAESTCVIRKHAPLNGSFEIKDDTGNAEKVIDAQLNRQYRNYRHKLHLQFQKYQTLAEALKHPPKGMSMEDWDSICCHFASAAFQKQACSSKANYFSYCRD